MPSRNWVAPPCAGWRTHASARSPSERSAVRPTATMRCGRSSAMAASSSGAPASTSVRVGARFVNGGSGPVRMCGHGVPQDREVLGARLGQRAVDDRAGRLGPAAGARRRRPERRAPLEQRPLRREGDAREAPAAVAHRLAHQQQRGAGAGVEVRRSGSRAGRPRRRARPAPDPRRRRDRGWRSRRARAPRAARAAPDSGAVSGRPRGSGRRRAWRWRIAPRRRGASGRAPAGASG